MTVKQIKILWTIIKHESGTGEMDCPIASKVDKGLRWKPKVILK